MPAEARSRAFLLIDNWDDWFTYNTIYSLIVYDARGEEFHAGGAKIDQFQMNEGQRHPTSLDEFDLLPVISYVVQ